MSTVAAEYENVFYFSYGDTLLEIVLQSSSELLGGLRVWIRLV